ncbi:MAG TPA: glycosyl hydrolase [Bryobacteraceae bacterium]|nr:glycosyl hydrolase [Bryobacteraceae bacterium]
MRGLNPHTALALLLAAGACATAFEPARRAASDYDTLRRSFEKPPADCRILMRWWWFGPAVTERELESEMESMRQAGIGGFEIQPVYPLSLDDPQRNIKNLPYLSAEFLNRLRFVSERARSLGVRVDLTLGSGWPFGGPNTSVAQAAGKLRIVRVPLSTDTRFALTPSIATGEAPIAAFLVRHRDGGSRRIDWPDTPRIPQPDGAEPGDLAVFFISSRTGQQVKRAALGAEGFVLDHYDRAAVEHHLETVGDRLLSAFGANPPWSVFSDSLEVYGSDWTMRLPEEFRRRRGYDLIPHLPDLLSTSPGTAAVRHDWARTLSELAEENFVVPVERWATAHHTRFRSQTYGAPPVILSSNAVVDLPEGEDSPHWRSFSVARWASSAGHLYSRNVISAETWTWLHTVPFSATPLDTKAEADRGFLQGVNQFVGHGWPYSPPSAGEPGWSLYAAAALNAHNPWWGVMPDLTQYLQRVSFLLRQGHPVNDVGLYLPTDDAWAAFKPGQDSVNTLMESMPVSRMIPRILDAGYNVDFVDDRTLALAATRYRAIVLPSIERIPLASLRTLADFAHKGGVLMAVGRAPSLAPGMREAGDASAIAAMSTALFHAAGHDGHFVDREGDLGPQLNALTTPDVRLTNAAPDIGFIHRAAAREDIYFIANTGNAPELVQAAFRVHGKRAERWDPFTGKISALAARETGREQTSLAMHLAPYESAVVVFTTASEGRPSVTEQEGAPEAVDLSTDWRVTFAALNRTVNFTALHSWTDDAPTRYYSGQAVYEKQVDVPAAKLRTGLKFFLNLGEGTPVREARPQEEGMRALLDGPVRESAVVYVNERLAGYVWHPPYEVNVTEFLQPGANAFRVVVGNLAINALAGKAEPDYRLLMSRYGMRFTPLHMPAKPEPSGLLGSVALIAR